MLHHIRRLVSPTHPLRLGWHYLSNAAARLRYGAVDCDLTIIGVTGTKGKTTTTNLLAAMLAADGKRVALASTATFRIGDVTWLNETKHTTLGRGRLYQFLRDAKAAGCTHVVLEVSSHALIQHRVHGIHIDAAVLTNIAPEHLDFHGTMADYVDAKAKLFRTMAATSAHPLAIVPADEPHAAHFVQSNATNVTFGMGVGDVRATTITGTPHGQRFTITRDGESFDVETHLIGGFNVKNILAAAACALRLGVSGDAIARTLATFAPVPGRLEPVDVGQPFRVIVDYAHTAEAFAELIATFRPITSGRLWVLYGACGDRDRSLRAGRGKILDELTDELIITTDDPYWEDEQQTIDDVMAGVKRHEHLFVHPDRRIAMTHALTHARAGDTVLLCGKGSETVRPTRGVMVPWRDKAVAEEILRERQ